MLWEKNRHGAFGAFQTFFTLCRTFIQVLGHIGGAAPTPAWERTNVACMWIIKRPWSLTVALPLPDDGMGRFRKAMKKSLSVYQRTFCRVCAENTLFTRVEETDVLESRSPGRKLVGELQLVGWCLIVSHKMQAFKSGGWKHCNGVFIIIAIVRLMVDIRIT